jgi:hypothetical protein
MAKRLTTFMSGWRKPAAAHRPIHDQRPFLQSPKSEAQARAAINVRALSCANHLKLGGPRRARSEAGAGIAAR